MIAELRQRHRRFWIVIAFVIPILAVLAWHARRPTAIMDRLPPQLVIQP